MGDVIPNDPEARAALNRFLGFQLSNNFPTLVLCACGIFGCFISAGVAQEGLYYDGFTYTSFLTLESKILCIVWGILVSGGKILYQRRAPHSSHLLLGFLTFATMYLSNESLKYLNYQSQNIWKSSKILPVLLVSTLFYQKKYMKMEYISAFLLFLGLVVFTIVDMKIDMNFSFLGILLILGALFADAFIGSVQEKMIEQSQCSTLEVLTFTNFYSSFFALIFCLGNNEFFPALEWISHNPQGFLMSLAYGIFNIIGCYFILYLILNFGVYLTTFITSLRKAFTILLSFLLFTKPFSRVYIIGYFLVSGSIYLNLLAGQEKQKKKAMDEKRKEEGEILLEMERRKKIIHGMDDSSSSSSSSPLMEERTMEKRPLLREKESR